MAIVTKTYITKSNTLIKNECANTGLNPVMELQYGRGLTRGIIYFDHEKLKKMVEDKTYPDITKLRHVLKMTNVASLKGVDIHRPCTDMLYNDDKERATSFDLILFLINKEWDEGNGFDYVKDMHVGEHRAYAQDGSNWYKYRNYFKWDYEGIYSNDRLSKELDNYTSKEGNLSKVIIGLQHFDHGNENLEIDITDTVNKFITGELENYGLAIAYAPSYENESTPLTQYVGFFTPHTHTFYEPYVETRYDETISDDRTDFYLDKDNKLYFYASVGGNSVNLDCLPTCTVNGEEMEVKQATKGVYYINIRLSSEEYHGDCMYYDVWTNIRYNYRQMPDVELSFVTKAPEGYFSFGLPSTQEQVEFIPSVYGINDHEQVKRGDVRKINIDCRIPYTTNQLRGVEGIEYRIYVNEGTRERDFTEWTKVERGYNENYFLVDTDEMIPARYYIDIKIHRDKEVFTHPKVLEFDIVNDTTDNLL